MLTCGTLIAIVVLFNKFRKFEKAMDVLQGDIDALEQEKVQLTKKLDMQSKKAIHAGIMGSRYSELLL